MIAKRMNATSLPARRAEASFAASAMSAKQTAEAAMISNGRRGDTGGSCRTSLTMAISERAFHLYFSLQHRKARRHEPSPLLDPERHSGMVRATAARGAAEGCPALRCYRERHGRVGF